MTLGFFKKISVSLGISLLSFVLMISFGFYSVSLNNQIKDLEERLLFLNRLTIRSQEAATLIKTHEEDFAAFRVCKFEQSHNPEMLQRTIGYALEFGQISNLNADPTTKGLVAQEVSFSIPCLKDCDIFALLDYLYKQGPGIFKIHDVTINRISALSEEMLEKIATGKPQTLFDGKIIATWIHR